jgi:glycosyltransferase involved in cell wall biosynthesis
MRVCIDIQSATANRAGVGRYTQRLVEHLVPLRGTDELACCYFDFQRRGEPFAMPGARQQVVRWCPGRYAQKAWKTISWPPFDLFSGPADVFHFPNFIRPPLSEGRSVVTIHDLAFLRMPETCERKNLAYLTGQINRTLDEADHVIAVSEFTAHELRELLDVPADRVTAIPSGLEPPGHIPDATEIQAARKMLKLWRPYVLSVGTLEPRKNYTFLADVFDALDRYDGDLVIAGMRGWKYEPILQRLAASPKAARIHYLEYVDDALLPGLYAGADAFLFPSHYEGFGFTPLEAMGLGTPVVSSAGGSLAEVLGDAALVLREWSVDLWRDAVQGLLADADRRQALAARGRAHVQRYRWEDAAARTWAVYRGLS